jgi:hypothetical protein
VSIATVSRVMHGQAGIRQSTRQRVLEVINDLGYVPDGAAQSMARHRKEVIGLVTAENPDGDVEQEGLLFVEQIFRGVELVLSRLEWSALRARCSPPSPTCAGANWSGSGVRTSTWGVRDPQQRTLAQLDKGGLRTDTPKSQAGKRTVAFPAEIAPEIWWHLERFAEPGDRGFVFIGPKGGKLRRSNFHKSVWSKARQQVGLPGLHFHDLRHTGGTLSAATGATLKELMARFNRTPKRAADQQETVGADDGNRTRMTSLEGSGYRSAEQRKRRSGAVSRCP